MSKEIYRNNGLLSNAGVLRRDMTKEERHLWYDCLRYCKPRFRRQEIIGNYIADFFCYEARLAIELDGSQHYEPSAAEGESVERPTSDRWESRFYVSAIRTSTVTFKGYARRFGSSWKNGGYTPQSAPLTAPHK